MEKNKRTIGGIERQYTIRKDRQMKAEIQMLEAETTPRVQAGEIDEAQRRWAVLRGFVMNPDEDKYKLRRESLEELGRDVFWWLFDYNTLESISLFTQMYFLIFGMLFDNPKAGNNISRDSLAAFTIVMTTLVMILFVMSVV